MNLFYVILFIATIALLYWLYKSSQSVAKIQAEGSTITIRPNYIGLLRVLLLPSKTTPRELTETDIAGFYGSTLYSPNGQFCAVYSSGHYWRGQWESGCIALIENKELKYKKTLNRILQAAISDNGYIAIYDDQRIYNSFTIINPSGELIFKNQITPNLYKIGISSDGSVAIFTTCSSKVESEYSDKFFIIDTHLGKIISLFELPLYFETIYIDTATRQINLYTKHPYCYKIDFTGLHINKEEYQDSILNGDDRDFKLRYLMNNLTTSQLFKNKIYQNLLLEKANDSAIALDDKAHLYRQLGEIYEFKKKYNLTIEYWEKALEINPKIGVKLRLAKLKSKINS